jgi:hypothetical protein
LCWWKWKATTPSALNIDILSDFREEWENSWELDSLLEKTVSWIINELNSSKSLVTEIIMLKNYTCIEYLSDTNDSDTNDWWYQKQHYHAADDIGAEWKLNLAYQSLCDRTQC